MPQLGASYNVATCRALAALAPDLAEAWDACNGSKNPFVSYAYLAQLERTGCVGGPRGWLPCHQLVFAQDVLVAAVPLYLRADSYGEFIFDWAWADAAAQHGIAYYPKLVSAVPYTPASGPRILRRPTVALADVLPALLAALQVLAQDLGASGVHFLFAQEEEVAALTAHGFTPRLSHQYHFTRAEGWQSFADFAAALRAPSRKQVRRERSRAQSHGLALSFREVCSLPADDLAALYAFYRQTVWEKGAKAYLTADFFAQLPRLPPQMAYVAMAHREGRPVAAALYFRGPRSLYGRYWGASEVLDALHFELCYYMPIAWGLEHGVDHFEAGAQGEHKIKRGLMPSACHSAHLLRHGGLHAAVSDFCTREARAVRAAMAQLAEHGPFARKHHGGGT